MEAVTYDYQYNAQEEFNSIANRRHSSSSGKLFVGGISWETSQVRRPRGFGFVTFANSAVADEVLSQEHTIDGRVVEVKRTVPREDMEVTCVFRTKKIFVGGLPQFFTDDELKEYFSTYGNIVECQIMLDRKTGRSRGFGFVTFDNEDSVEKVFSAGKIHELGGKQVEIKKAEPKRSGADNSSSSQNHMVFLAMEWMDLVHTVLEVVIMENGINRILILA
ncbi:hypothetical protein PIB30_005585 [Stylosanthes scabra]|uniref:RRM domain-containing protein n=1 Tax=Stylosanthes scabra TaxID=79078 RepID=A0ABU6R4F2_9FABA|nr:hypothetical protein [Stylosanthes scabra]